MDLFWEKHNWELNDRHLQGLRQAPFRRPFPELELRPRSLYIIRGPRQIGKSSWLKSILSQQVGLSRSCFYVSCENITSQAELAEQLKSVRHRSVIILDEVTYVPSWALAVKHELDRNFAGTIIVTGSNSIDLLRGGEQLPGRFGDGGEFELLPMEFTEFQAMRRQAGWTALSREEELLQYFAIGGFPIALIEAGQNGLAATKSALTIRKWIVGDMVRSGKDEQYLREVLGQLALTLCTPISLQSLAQKTQLGSHHTVKDYLALLEAMFVLRTLYNIDSSGGSFRFRDSKKFYFRDPLLFWMALEFAGFKQQTEAMSLLAEQVAAEYLARRYTRLGFYRVPTGEVDFYVHGEFGIEVKWSEVATNLSKAYFNLLVPERMVWTKRNYLLEMPKA